MYVWWRASNQYCTGTWDCHVSCLNKLSDYCNLWGLNINIKKTNIVIYNKGGHNISRFKFTLRGNEVAVVNHYCYLGIIFSSCGSFSKAINALHDKAKKAFFRLRQIDPRNDVLLTIKLFDMIVPMDLKYAPPPPPPPPPMHWENIRPKIHLR